MGTLGTWYSILNGTYNPKTQPVQGLDALSRWLVATRSVVFVMTVNSVIIGTLLAVTAVGVTSVLLPYFILLALGLTFAHATSNLFNDYWDAKHGIDTTEGYFRPAYLPHPSISGMMSQKGLFSLGLVHLVAMVAIASYFVVVRGPLVILFAGLGVVSLTLYAGGPKPLKRIGLGEPAVFLVWGPLMVGGSYYVLTGALPAWIIIASIPYAVSVTTVLFGKHIDKIDYDAKIGVKTLPVILGEKTTKSVLKALIVIAYAAVVGLVLIRLLPVWSLLSLLALPKANQLFRNLSEPKPNEPPAGYVMWPIWYLGFVFAHNRRFGTLFVFGLLLGVLFPYYLPLA
ncbi:MAG: prenyltransferase [Nitrososphaerales archaeon]|nr:prenyltransferase [Nitrososphaerales archaeon]